MVEFNHLHWIQRLNAVKLNKVAFRDQWALQIKHLLCCFQLLQLCDQRVHVQIGNRLVVAQDEKRSHRFCPQAFVRNMNFAHTEQIVRRKVLKQVGWVKHVLLRLGFVWLQSAGVCDDSALQHAHDCSMVQSLDCLFLKPVIQQPLEPKVNVTCGFVHRSKIRVHLTGGHDSLAVDTCEVTNALQLLHYLLLGIILSVTFEKEHTSEYATGLGGVVWTLWIDKKMCDSSFQHFWIGLVALNTTVRLKSNEEQLVRFFASKCI